MMLSRQHAPTAKFDVALAATFGVANRFPYARWLDQMAPKTFIFVIIWKGDAIFFWNGIPLV